MIQKSMSLADSELFLDQFGEYYMNFLITTYGKV